MISAILSRLVILLFGTLYPAYASYKAVRTKNVKEYVKWMMYWIVFALFTCAETFTDVFLSFWFPFYYEIKVVLVIWLLSPATKGSSILYRNFVHPALTKREQEIDEYISKAKEQGYHTMLHLGSKGVTYATSVIMQTAIKGGGGIVNHLRRSYSLSDLSADADLKADLNRNSKLQGDAVDTADVPRDSRMRTPRKPGGSHVDLYFPEMDVDIRSHPHHPHEIPLSLGQIRSIEDISSGYSSAEPLFGEGQVMPEGNPLMRTASVGATRARARGGRATTQPKKALTTEEEQDDIMADYGWQHALPPLPIASLFPELLHLDPSGLPPQAFLSPETLQILYSNRVFRDHESRKVHEFKEEEGINMNSADTKTSYEHFKVAKKENALKKSDEIIEPIENITSNDKNEKSDEKIPFSEPYLPSLIKNPENITTEKSQESVSTPVLEKEVDISLSKLVTSESSDKMPEEHFTDNFEQISERFEDASDAEVYASPTMENLFEQTHNKSVQLTSSAESVSSSEEQYFEDSLPDVTSVTGRDSPSVSERKGKYNKGRAPPPPEVKIEETEVTFEEPLAESSISTTELNSSLMQSQMLKSDLFNKTSTVNDYGIYDGSRQSEQYKYEKRDVSPTPSQSKKDSSNFSRFLPKTSVTSLFNFWGSKDETPGGNKSKTSLSRSPSNSSVKSSSSGRFYKPSSPSNISNIEYTLDSDISRNERARGKTSPKLKIRQMSQSPSRKRHQNFD